MKLPEFGDRPDALLELLERKATLWRGRVLMPASDLALEVVSRDRDRLASRYRLAVPPWEVTRILLEKNRLRKAAEEAGLDLPRCHGPISEADVRPPAVRFPVVLKPADSKRFERRAGRRLLVARNDEELAQGAAVFRRLGFDGEIVELIPGPDPFFYNYSVYMDAGGEPVGGLAMHKLRKSPPFYGVCRVAETDVDPAVAARLREPTVALLRRIGWRGMANAEYKWDARDGSYRFMEVNGRCFMMQGVAMAAGVNYALLAWEDATFDKVSAAAAPVWKGSWIHLHADLLHALLRRRAEGLRFRDYLAPYRGPKRYAVWSLTDPKPFLVEWARTLRQAAAWAARRNRRSPLLDEIQPMPAKIHDHF
ncbi:MAG: hypothetical protein KIT09_14815 [Bryobacteraceae bacterium]|nr:hypothetical protein [Bryobacteraceae bacterium]